MRLVLKGRRAESQAVLTAAPRRSVFRI
jgi:hypothetical protein